MATKKFMSVLLSVFVATWFLGHISQTMAETWKLKSFQHTTKVEGAPIPDAEGHIVTMFVREGPSIYDNGEWAWTKTVTVGDMTKGVGSFFFYAITTFQDGSTIISLSKGTSGGPATQFTGEIIHGTGRFQGIKGTTTSTSMKTLPPAKGETMGKVIAEVTLNFTLPPK
jgi:hypothetical protein